MPSASPKLLNLNQEHPSKKLVFLLIFLPIFADIIKNAFLLKQPLKTQKKLKELEIMY